MTRIQMKIVCRGILKNNVFFLNEQNEGKKVPLTELESYNIAQLFKLNVKWNICIYKPSQF